MANSLVSSIIASMRQYIKNLYPSLFTGEGGILNDVVISAPSQQIGNLYDQLTIVQNDQAVETASDTGLNSLSSNFSITAKPAVSSQGIETFFSNNPLTNNITIPAGTLVSTIATTASPGTFFITVQTVTMYASLSSTYFNPVTNKYEIQTLIQASNPGSAGNVAANTIIALVNPISGINGCYNPYDMSGGVDTESPDSLRSRIITKSSGINLDSVNGLLSLIEAQTGVQNALVVGHGQTQRKGWGAVDIYVQGETSRPYSEVFSIFSNSLTLIKQPVLLNGITSVLSSNSGSIGSNFYSLSKDSGSYGGSIEGRDQLILSESINSSYGSIYVSYNYNGLIEDLQNLFTMSNYSLLNSDILVRQAVQILIDVTLNIKILSGFDPTVVIADVESVISQFLSQLGIGQTIKQTDIVSQVLLVPGISDIELPFTTFQSDDGTILPDSFNNLEIPYNSYPVANIITAINVV